MYKFQPVSMSLLDYAEFSLRFCDGLFRADLHTTTAAMAEFMKRQDRLTNDDNGLELAYFRAFSAQGAFVHIHRGNGGGDGFDLFNGGLDKKM